MSKHLPSTSKLINCKFRFYIEKTKRHLAVIIIAKNNHYTVCVLLMITDYPIEDVLFCHKNTARSLFSPTSFKIKSYMTSTD